MEANIEFSALGNYVPAFLLESVEAGVLSGQALKCM